MSETGPLSLPELRKYRNHIIGNKCAKIQLGQDTSQIALILRCLDREYSDEIRTEAARIISSLAYGGSESSQSLLSCHALRSVIKALSFVIQPDGHSTPGGRNISPDSAKLTVALTRALRSLASTYAALVGPPLWGLTEERQESDVLKSTARAAIAEMLTKESLDIILPFLRGSSPNSGLRSAMQSVVIEIAVLIGNVIKSPEQQTLLLDWLPPDQSKTTSRPISGGRSIVRRSSSGAWGQPRSPTAGGSWAQGPPVSPSILGALPTSKNMGAIATSPVKPKRGWEAMRTPTTLTSASLPPAHDSGWVIQQLVGHIGGIAHRDYKLVESAMFAVAALSKDCTDVAIFINSVHGGSSILTQILDHATRPQSHAVQVAACLAATRVVRALPHHHPHPPTSPIHTDRDHSPQPSTSEKTILDVLSELISTPIDEVRPNDNEKADDLHHRFNGDHWADEVQVRERACFVLHSLVMDSPTLVSLAYERGVVRTLVRVIRSITPLPSASDEYGVASHAIKEERTIMEDEPLCVSLLREASLKALSTLCIISPEVRRIAVEDHPAASAASSSPSPSPSLSSSNLGILPHITRSFYHPSVGVRFAAVQCIRALARSVAVMRTSVCDSGAVEIVWDVVVGEAEALRKGVGVVTNGNGKRSEMIGKEREDKRVVDAAMQAMINLVNDFSPVKQVYIDKGIIEQLRIFLSMDIAELEPSFRFHALWIYKNLLVRSPMALIEETMNAIGWDKMRTFLAGNVDVKIREQVFSILRNVACDDLGIDLVYSKMGPENVLGLVCGALESDEEDIALQASGLLGNLSNSTETYPCSIVLTTKPNLTLHQNYTLSAPLPSSSTSPIPILNSIRHALTEYRNVSVQAPLMRSISSIAMVGHKERKAILDAGIGGTLKRICEWSGKVPRSSGSGGGGGNGHGASGLFKDEKEVVDLARKTLDGLEHGGEWDGL